MTPDFMPNWIVMYWIIISGYNAFFLIQILRQIIILELKRQSNISLYSEHECIFLYGNSYFSINFIIAPVKMITMAFWRR